MSQSRSTFSTPDIPSPSSDSTISKTPVQLSFPSELTLPEKESQSPPLTQVHLLPHPNQSSTLDPMNSQMTRQSRLGQTVSKPFLSYSTSSYSQESVGDSNKGKRPSEATGPSPKKKRTRTLTTPHQAAVLHALLAKSRFPNATVREEVGRSIGLSARKVQVWFQNQRQKARRPQSQSKMSHRLLHHFSTFPSGFGSFPLTSEPSSSYSTSTSYSTETGRSVARPGMPGLKSSSDLTYYGRPGPAYEGFMRYSDLRDQSPRSPSLVRLYLQSPVPASTRRPYEHDPSRTLPPLVFPPVLPPALPRPSFSAPGSSAGPSHAALGPPHHRERRSLSPANIFSYQPPESTAPITWPHPSAVQPQLQRPASSFESTREASHSSPSWALHEHSTASRSVTPPGPAIERPPSSGVTAAAARPPGRSRRYDPIRGTFIYSSPPEEQ